MQEGWAGSVPSQPFWGCLLGVGWGDITGALGPFCSSVCPTHSTPSQPPCPSASSAGCPTWWGWVQDWRVPAVSLSLGWTGPAKEWHEEWHKSRVSAVIQGLGALASLRREGEAREGQVHKHSTACGCLESFLLLSIWLQSPQTPANVEYAPPALHRGNRPQGRLSQLPNTHHPSWWAWTPPPPASSGPSTPNSLQPCLLLSWLL